MNDPAYHKKWRVDRELGRPRLVDAQPVRAHVNTLLAAHLPIRAVADTASVSPSAVHRIAHRRQRRVRVDIARKLLAVTLDDVYTRNLPAGFVPNIGARRRIRALLALGWRHQDINTCLDENDIRTRSQMLLHQVGGWISRSTHDAVWRIYASLSDHRGPSDRTRGRAAKLGYPPPAAWDETDMDDPYAPEPAGYTILPGQCTMPGCDEATHADGLCRSHYHSRRHPQVRVRELDLDEWAFLVRTGEDPDRAAHRCGGSGLGSVRKAVDRKGRTDLVPLLRQETAS